LGGLKWYSKLSFKEHVIDCQISPTFYLYTDGVIDQPQARIDKVIRYGHPNWLTFVEEIGSLPLAEQKTHIQEMLNSLLAVHNQRDDISIIGLRV